MTKYHGTDKNKGNKGVSYNVNVLGVVQVVLVVVVVQFICKKTRLGLQMKIKWSNWNNKMDFFF